MDEKGRLEITTHINEHVSYPITKQDLIAACGNLSHVPADTKQWVEQALPDRTYRSAEEVLHALDLPHEH